MPLPPDINDLIYGKGGKPPARQPDAAPPAAANPPPSATAGPASTDSQAEPFDPAHPLGPGPGQVHLPTDEELGEGFKTMAETMLPLEAILPRAGLGLGSTFQQLAQRTLGRFTQPVRVAGKMARREDLPARFSRQMIGQTATATRPAISSKAAMAGRTAERVMGGAVVGGELDPDNRVRGAILGAGGELVPPALAGVLGTRIGRWISGHALSHGSGIAAEEILRHAGLPYGGFLAYPMLAWSVSPFGRALHQGGYWIADNAGRILGWIPRGAAGAVPSGAARAVSAAGGPPPGSTYVEPYTEPQPMGPAQELERPQQ